ncbi:MAG TPA: hypothetical protein VJ871_03430 [Bacteroidales bacterium]|nr:hypothetical protein [Bacteroidales bacterium]
MDKVNKNCTENPSDNYLGANWGYDYWWGNRVSLNLPFLLDMGKIR